MKNAKSSLAVLWVLLMFVCLQIPAFGQEQNRLAVMSSSGSSVRWEMAVPYSTLTLTVAAPDGRVFRRELKAGAAPVFAIMDDQGEKLPDGVYSYELRLTPIFSPGVKEALAAARGKDDDPEAVRAARKRLPDQGLVQSGAFSIMNGSVVDVGATEPGSKAIGKVSGLDWLMGMGMTNVRPAARRQHHSRFINVDQVIPDDLIVQGSACVGLDCVNNESFGFDTIRVKENNTRFQFDDTSAAGFATNNWQIRANAQGGGGASFLGFVDQGATGNSETGTIVFEVDAGAPANSLRVASNGKVGFRTATPVLDMHANTSDTPAIRLEQNNTGGFTAQTWDIGANEANFFVRDVTSGSRLPFRIRPGAPTSSLDISATGNVGIATGSPGTALDVSGNTITVGSDSGTSTRTNNTTKLQRLVMPPFTTTNLNFAVVAGATTSTDNIAGVGGAVGGSAAATVIVFHTAATTNTDTGSERMRITSGGNVGIGTNAPTDLLSVNGTASKPGGGSWAIFSDERLKLIKGRFNSGLKAVMQLQPLRYEYKTDNALRLPAQREYVGFGAQALLKVIPEAVSTTDTGYLQVNNDPILWTMLNAIKEQQHQIEELKREVRTLRKSARTKR